MKIKKAVFVIVFLIFIFPAHSLHAYWVWSPESGKFVNPEKAVQDTADEQYDYAMKFYKEKDLDEAGKQLELLLKKYPGSPIASEAQYRLGTIHEEKGDFVKAFKAYKVLTESYPQSERLAEVVEREFRIGNLFLSGKKGKLMGLEILPSLPRAVEVFEHIMKQAPYSEFGDKAQFHLGLAYKKWAHYGEAVEAFQAVIDRYPKSELLPQARFQLAETSFLRSSSEFRDQRVLDDASHEVEQFLSRYPDSSALEKATKLRQEIDERNAEKNYRIGLYYEKENYVSGSLIYYADVAARYAHTKWGEKAKEKLRSLEKPAEYISGEEKKVRQEREKVETQLKSLTDHRAPERQALEGERKRLAKREKDIGKSKKETLNRREQDVKRREGELRQKFKNLNQKKKQAKHNPSEDFKRAIERWEASLISEKETLVQERKQLKGWRQTLGIPKKFSADFLPFVEEPMTEVEKVQRIGTKELYQLSRRKKVLLSKKETLYKQRGEISALLDQWEIEKSTVPRSEILNEAAIPLAATAGEDRQASRKRLEASRSEIERLEKALEEKRTHYEEQVPSSSEKPALWKSVVKAPTQVVSASFDFLNPFDGSETPQMNLQGLLERRMHIKEKIAVQQSLVETLSHAFDTELAIQEQKRLLADLQAPGKTDPLLLRKTIRRLEKQIASRYREIEDRHKQKEKWVQELDTVLKEKRARDPVGTKAARLALRPVRGFIGFWKAFLFGLPAKEVEVTQSASSLKSEGGETERAVKLKEAIELESLLIEARSREIMRLRKDLDIMKAKASLAGGFKFRSAMITLPYQFIEEAVESAKRIVPRKTRQEILVHRLDKETQELENLKKELKQVEVLIDEKTVVEGQTSAAVEPPSEEVDRANLAKEVQGIAEELEKERQIYRHEESLLASSAPKAREKQTNEQTKEQPEKTERLGKELREIEAELSRLISKEKDLEEEESSILGKRIQEIDRAMAKIQSRALSQDLLTERERIEERLAQIQSRRDFLSKERGRFQLAQTGARSS